jgi:hypothetical protein
MWMKPVGGTATEDNLNYAEFVIRLMESSLDIVLIHPEEFKVAELE